MSITFVYFYKQFEIYTLLDIHNHNYTDTNIFINLILTRNYLLLLSNSVNSGTFQLCNVVHAPVSVHFYIVIHTYTLQPKVNIIIKPLGHYIDYFLHTIHYLKITSYVRTRGDLRMNICNNSSVKEMYAF